MKSTIAMRLAYYSLALAVFAIELIVLPGGFWAVGVVVGAPMGILRTPGDWLLAGTLISWFLVIPFHWVWGERLREAAQVSLGRRSVMKHAACEKTAVVPRDE